MVKSTESRKFARTTNYESHTQFAVTAKPRDSNKLLDDHRALEPPDPIPNSVVKRRIADGSVVLHHVRVGHRQAPIRNPRFERGGGFFFAARKIALRVGCTAKDAGMPVRAVHPTAIVQQRSP